MSDASQGYDWSTAWSTFSSIGVAIKNADPEVVYKSVVLGNPMISYANFHDKIWDSQEAECREYSVLSKAARASGSAVAFFTEGEILAEKVGWGERKGARHRVLVVRWNKLSVIREENMFVLPGETSWRWCPDPNTTNHPVYDGHTPAHAYMALIQSLRLKLVEQLCELYGTSVLGGMSPKQCAQMISVRLFRLSREEQETKWSKPTIGGGGEQDIEEETLPSDGSGRVLCKVWRLAAPDRKRGEYELFIKEGNKWKWLPKEDSFWYPSKMEKQQSTR